MAQPTLTPLVLPLDAADVRARVADRRTLAEGVIALRIERTDGEAWAPWAPGAHIDLLLPDGTARQYSLAGSPDDRRVLEIAILREDSGRGGSIWIHDNVHPASEISVRGPRNHFALKEADEYRFVAGGIGITPLLPMIEAAKRRGKPWRLAYCGRSRQTMAYLDRLAEHADAVALYPRDETDRADLAGFVTEPGAGAAVYACGPERLLDALEAARATAGLPPPVIEHFAPKDLGDLVNTRFEIELVSDGRVMPVAPDQTILEVLRINGVNVIASCQEGTCGTCETGVISGVPEHRDSVLTAEEHAQNDYMMICCSRSNTPRLVLDL